MEYLAEINQGLMDARNERVAWEPFYKDSIEFVNPMRRGVDWRHVMGLTSQQAVVIATDRAQTLNYVNDRRAESTATYACTIASDGLAGSTCGPDFIWFRLKSQIQQINEAKVFREWVEAVEDRLYAAFMRSNFYGVMPEFLFDGHSLANATMYVDETADAKIRCIAINPLEIYIKEDEQENITTTWRVFKMRKRVVAKKFPGREQDFPQLNEQSPGDPYLNIIHCVYRSDQFDYAVDNMPASPTCFDPRTGKMKPYIGVYYFENMAADAEHGPLCIEGYYENPYITWRYRKNTGETYGNCPAFDARPDILALNMAARAYSRQVQLEADPPLQAPGSLQGRIEFKPRGVTYRDFGNDGKVERLFEPSRTNVTIQFIEMYQKRIMDTFRANTYMAMTNLAQNQNVPETMEIKAEKASLMGPVAARLGTEFLDKIIKRFMGIEMRANRLPPPPQGMPTFMKVEYTGPLYQAQKRMQKIGTIMDGLQVATPILQLFPASAMRLNPDGMMKEALNVIGMPSDTTHDDLEVAQMQQAQQIKDEQAQKAAALAQISDAYAKTVVAPGQRSGAAQLMQQLGGGQ